MNYRPVAMTNPRTCGSLLELAITQTLTHYDSHLCEYGPVSVPLTYDLTPVLFAPMGTNFAL
ncbi:hypothetical protein Plhal304r1_c003g0011801 [Plasmopara halstedii]